MKPENLILSNLVYASWHVVKYYRQLKKSITHIYNSFDTEGHCRDQQVFFSAESFSI